MRRTLNVKWLVGSVIVVAVLAGGTHWLHGFQVRRNAGSLLEVADRAEQKGDLEVARTSLERYVALAPQDTDALARHAFLLDRLAKTDRDRLAVFFALEKVLRQASDRHDARRRLVRVAVSLHRYTDARDHLTTLLQSFPDDAELEEMLGQCEEGTTQFATAAEWYGKALKRDSHRIECYARLAELLRRRLDKAEEADRVMDELIKSNPDALSAYLLRARYRLRFFSADLAAQDVEYARKHLAPDDPEVLLAAAEIDFARDRPIPARAALQRGLELYPDNLRFMQTMARLELQSGHRDEAAKLARRALPASGNEAQDLWGTADLLIDAGEFSDAQALLPRLEKAGLSPVLLDYLRARLCIGEQRWGEARRLLERARPHLNPTPELLLQTHLMLALCHQRLGNSDLQLAAYRSAIEVDGSSIPARFGLAAATAIAGRDDEALALYERLGSQIPSARLLAVRLVVQRQLRLRPEQRQWAGVEKAFKELPEDLRQGTEGRLLWGEVLRAQDRIKEADTHLTAARKEYPENVDIRIALVSLAAQQKEMEQVTALLDEAENDLGNRVELRLARAALLAGAPDKDAHARLKDLATDWEGISRDDQLKLWQGLMPVALRLNELALARSLGERLSQRLPNDVEVRTSLFRIALQARDAATARRLGDDIRQIEGEEGTFWRYAEAAQRVRFAAASDTAALAEARTRLAEVSRARPNWAPAALLEADLCEREGNVEGAIDQYRRAVALGERQPVIVRRVVQLLHERRRFPEAQEVLRKLQEQAPLSADLGRLAAEVSLFNQQAPEQTLELARKAVAAEPSDFRSQLWLGQVLAALHQPEDAEKAFRKAVEVKSEVPDPWVALVLFLVQSKKQPAAESAYREADKKLGKGLTPLMRGMCLEALGDRAKALEQYRVAVAAAPKDSTAIRATVGFYMHGGQFVEAEELLRKQLAGGSEGGMVVWARRQLALVLTASGNYAKVKEAQSLIEANLQRVNPAVEDQRLRAVILASQPARRRDSIAALEQSFVRQPATPDEQFLLAQLYEAERDWPKARSTVLDALTATDNKNPLYLTYFVARLLHHHQTEEAEFWLGKLAKCEPGSWRTVQATARLRAQQGNAAEAVKLVNAYAKETPGKEWMPASLLEELGQSTEAESLYRQYLSSAKTPEASLLLASHLGRRGKHEEALDLCEKVNGSPEAVARVAVGVARSAGAKPAVIQRVDRWLTATLARTPDAVPLLLAQADLRDLQGNYSESESVYRQVLRRESNNAIACNNLAVLLALQKKTKEALELSERALELEGPVPYFLDTRAVARLAAEQGPQAVRDLEEAVNLQPTAPRYFHLVLAHRTAKDHAAAGAAWAKAKALGLTSDALHPLERKTFEGIAAEMEEK